ncbi:MAG: hypothetical protein J6I64_05125, partial [Lachnospiraceae bacterium]|nr:hypothetical protein [Lachnospiraceae bacterium]
MKRYESFRKRRRSSLSALLSVLILCLSGCQPQSITMDLEGMALDASGQAMIQAMEEYQAAAVETYSYPVIGPWISVNRTASIQGAENDELIVFTRNEEDGLEWRRVQYVYPFYEGLPLAEGSANGEEPLVVAPLIVSPDGLAVAYQSL